ncbi:MAG: hypothetical protein JXJ04_16360 [Spirochaetales bacterium]|nr:hypothetical protein [Spirochaetales bacterium]
MGTIEDLLRKRKELLEQIDDEIRSVYTKPVTLLFTDIVGSTRYFETMGDIPGRQMIQTHNDLLFPIITAHEGKIIKTIGDSIMASFSDPVKSIESAIAMQKALQRYNKEKKAGSHLLVRMGLHFGQAVVDDKDLFGDMVNTSARVEARANGEEILISGALMEEIKGQGFPVVFLGSDFVKGKSGKIDFYLINWNNKPEKEIALSWEIRNRQKTTVEAPKQKKQTIAIRKKNDLKTLAGKIDPLTHKGNPYLNRVMIPHPDMFFGRKGIIKRIMNRISAESPQSVSIVGERRIGKSSLLKYLTLPRTRLEHIDDPEKYIFLFIDFQQIRGIDEKELIGIIFSELKKNQEYDIEISCEANHDGMKFLCDHIIGQGYKFILFFDEFESVTKNTKIGPEFYSFFRSLANNFPIAFVTASGRNLKDMCVSHEISDSPFFNIFTIHHLNLFSKETAKELITRPSRERGIPLESLTDHIIQTGGLYPFFLQMACSAWFDFLDAEESSARAAAAAAAEDYAAAAPPREVMKMFREESYPHFEFICETLGNDELDVLKLLAAGKQLDPDSHAAEILERKGYVMRKNDNSITFFSKEFELFVKKRFPV